MQYLETKNQIHALIWLNGALLFLAVGLWALFEQIAEAGTDPLSYLGTTTLLMTGSILALFFTVSAYRHFKKSKHEPSKKWIKIASVSLWGGSFFLIEIFARINDWTLADPGFILMLSCINSAFCILMTKIKTGSD